MSSVSATAYVGVLNATYAPLGPTKLARALALVIDGRAVIQEADESQYIRSVGGVKIPLPKVIRLLNAIKVPFYVAEEYFSRRGVLERDGRKCGYCLAPATTWDHIQPSSRGGADSWMNSIAACLRCNSKKANRTPEEAGMPLLFQPTVPTKMYLNSGKKPNKRRK